MFTLIFNVFPLPVFTAQWKGKFWNDRQALGEYVSTIRPICCALYSCYCVNINGAIILTLLICEAQWLKKIREFSLLVRHCANTIRATLSVLPHLNSPINWSTRWQRLNGQTLGGDPCRLKRDSVLGTPTATFYVDAILPFSLTIILSLFSPRQT
jgi:hypothetical protein